MLFLNIKKYGWDAHVFGTPPERRGGFSDQPHLNENYTCDLLRYSNLPRMYGESFDNISISGKTLVGHLQCPYWAYSVRNGVPQEATLPHLVLAYVRKKVETPFETWLAQNPLLKVSRDRTHMGIFVTYEGEFWLAYLEAGKLRWDQISEPSFISEGFITTVETAMHQQLAAVRKKVTEVEDMHAKLRDVPFDFPQLLSRSDLLNFARSY